MFPASSADFSNLSHPSLSASALSPPTCFSLFTNSSDSIALSVSVQLRYPTQTVLSLAVFLPPNLLFVLCRLQHSLVMFFFLRSHFRTSEGDQEKIGLRKNLQLKAPVPRLLSRSRCNIVKHSDLVRLCLRNKLLVVAHVSSGSLMHQSRVSCHGYPLPTFRNQGLVSRDVTGWSPDLFLNSTNTSLSLHATNNPAAFPPLIPPSTSSPETHTGRHTPASLPSQWKEFQMRKRKDECHFWCPMATGDGHA